MRKKLIFSIFIVLTLFVIYIINMLPKEEVIEEQLSFFDTDNLVLTPSEVDEICNKYDEELPF